MANISGMRLRLQELQETNAKAQEVNGMLQHQGLLFVPKIIWMELISRHHDDLLASHFNIKKICKPLARKYYCPTLRHNIEAYGKGCDIYLASKTAWHKLYNYPQSLPISIYQWKDLSINFMTSQPISTDWKGDNYNSILIIVDWLIKIVYYKLVKITIDALGLAEVIINVVV